MTSFENTEIAFISKSDGDLRRAHWLFKMVSRPSFVRLGKSATRVAFLMGLPIKGIIKQTIFRQFCGGESIQESIATANRLAKFKVRTILDYSIEGKTDEEDFDSTVREIVATIEEAKNNPNIPFAVFKVTGICRFDLLAAANDEHAQLNDSDQRDFDQLIARVDTICNAAHTADIPVFIDAEESWIQDTIDRIATRMMERYNLRRAIVYNTLQMYRHDRLDFFKKEIVRAREKKYFLGVKIVRGAYMEKERDRAKEKGYPSPIQPDKVSSDKDFNLALDLAMHHLNIVAICCGSHNEESSLLLANLIQRHKIPLNDERVYFAQLLGMSDHISFNLANDGYNVAKYVPYGPVKEVMPYLIRRAEENTSVAGQTGRELALITKERKRRRNLTN